MRILFMGTPDFAVPSLRALAEGGHEVCGAFTQPDRPKNRGMKLLPPPVKEFCVQRGIPVFQPEGLRSGEALERVRSLAPELIVVAAYGRILPPDILDAPPWGCVNVHSSLLPKYRGAAPIQWALLNGETETGVTILHMAPELDAGDLIAQARTPIGPDETAPELTARLAGLGARLLLDTVARIAAGTARRAPQDAARATYAPMLSKALSPMDFSRSAGELHNQARALLPWPAAVTRLGGVRCKVLSTAVCEQTTSRPPGAIVQADGKGLKLACGGGTVLEVRSLQPDGKRAMTAGAFLLGRPLAAESGAE